MPQTLTFCKPFCQSFQLLRIYFELQTTLWSALGHTHTHTQTNATERIINYRLRVIRGIIAVKFQLLQTFTSPKRTGQTDSLVTFTIAVHCTGTNRHYRPQKTVHLLSHTRQCGTVESNTEIIGKTHNRGEEKCMGYGAISVSLD